MNFRYGYFALKLDKKNCKCYIIFIHYLKNECFAVTCIA